FEQWVREHTAEWIADKVGATKSAVYNRAQKKGFPFSEVNPQRVSIDWPDDETFKEWVREHTAEWIADKVGASRPAVYKRAREKGFPFSEVRSKQG
ncbi:MAG: hypothetical protein ABEN55_03795, partial [Bradymonadaceae bacterium]